jgi:hypothetical protein
MGGEKEEIGLELAPQRRIMAPKNARATSLSSTRTFLEIASSMRRLNVVWMVISP